MAIPDMITSPQNEKIKLIRAIRTRARARYDLGVFLCEGVRLLEEGSACGWPTRFVLYAEGMSERAQTLIAQYERAGIPVEEVTPKIMRDISDTEKSQGVLGVMSLSPIPLPAKRDLVVIPAQIRDPGNLGTIIRTAAAAGVDAVLIPPGTTDAFAPKVLRAGMGAHFRLPLHTMNWNDIHAYLDGTPKLRTYLADVGHGQHYTRVDLRLPLAFVIGGEAFGVDRETLSYIDEIIHIHMPGNMDSLNAASAAAVLLFECLRQRQEIPLVGNDPNRTK